MTSQPVYHDWGGKRHHSKPHVDVGLLFKVVSTHKALIQNMGSYENTSRTGSPDPVGLHFLLPLVGELVTVSSIAEIHSQSLRSALQQLVVQDAEVNNSKYNGQVWVNLRSERIGCVLAHMRQLAREPETLKKAALVLTGKSFHQLKEVVNKITGQDKVGSETPSSSTAVAPVSSKTEDDVQTGRQLKVRVSDSALSLDSNGFPRMLDGVNSPAKTIDDDPESTRAVNRPSFLRRRLVRKMNHSSDAASSREEVKSSPNEVSLREALGYDRVKQTGKGSQNPQAKRKSQGKRRCKKTLAKVQPQGATSVQKPTMKKPSASVERRPWVVLRRTNASKPERSYICGAHSKDDKIRLIVEVTQAWTSAYWDITTQIFKSLQEDSITKEEALGMRQRLIKEAYDAEP